MPEITADELAAVLGEKCQHFKQDFRTMVLPYSDWDHIIACLREHEERAHWVKSDWGSTCIVRGTWAGEVRGQLASWAWYVMGGQGWCESETSAKAVVEKAVRP